MFAYQRYIASPTPHFVVDYYCYYPSNMTGNCNTVYNTPPSMRMCACSIASCVDNGSYGVPHYRRALLGESEEQGQSVSEVEYVQSELMARGAKVAAVRAAETAAEEAVVEDVMQEEDSVLSYMTAVVGAVATASFVAAAAAANTAVGISEEYQWVALLVGVVGLLAAAAAAVSLVFAAFRKPLESTPAGRKYTATTTSSSSSSSGRRTKRDIHIDMPDADGLAFGGKMS
jgi:hypothetical protein